MSRCLHPGKLRIAFALLGIASGSVVADGAVARFVSSGSTTFHLVNVGADPALAAMSLRPQGGGEAERIEGLSVPARGVRHELMERQAIPRRVRYAGALEGAAEVALVAQSDWASGGGVAVEGAAASEQLVVPYAVRASRVLRTLVTVQNTDPNTPASVEVTILGVGGAGELASFHLDVAAGSSTTFEVGRAPEPALADFEGALRLVGDRPIAASVFVDGLNNSLGGAGFLAVSPVDVGPRLVAPFLPIAADSVAGRRLETLVAIQNVAATDAAVAIELVGVTAACVGQTATVPLEVPAGDAAHVDLSPAVTGLAEGCVAAGTIEADADSRLAATVLLAGNTTGLSAMAAYTARPDAAARTALWVPVLRRANTEARLDTDVWLFNPGTDPATIDVEVRDQDGGLLGCVACQIVVPAGGGASFSGAIGGALAEDAAGYGVIIADRPLIGVVEEAGPLDAPPTANRDSVVYGLVSAADLGRRWVPLALLWAAEAPPEYPAPPPTPWATPGPAVWPTSVAGRLEVEVFHGMIGVYNRGSTARDASIRLLPRVPGPATAVVIPGVAPGRSAARRLLGQDYGQGAFAAVVGDADVVDRNGGIGWITGAVVEYGPARSDTKIVLPLALQAVERAHVRIVNASSVDAQADVRVDGHLSTRSIPASGYVALAVPPGTTAVEIASASPLVASALVFNDADMRAAYDVAGHGRSAASTELWTPRAYRRAAMPGGLGIARSTRVVIANPGDVAVDVTLRLDGAVDACAGQPIAVGPRPVPAGSAIAIDLASEPAVPNGCEGPLRILASGPVVANGVVHVSSAGAVVAAAAAPLVPAASGRTSAWIRYLSNDAPSFAPARTDIAIVNPGPVASRVQLMARDSADREVAVAEGDVVVQPGESHVFRADIALAALHGRSGTGTILASEPVVARIDQWGYTGKTDVSSAILGNAALATAAPGEEVLPWANVEQAIITPTPPSAPPATPEAPLAIVAAAFVDVAGGSSSSCPSCDGIYAEDDRNAAITSPLPTIRFVVRDAEGRVITASDGRAVSGMQVARLTFAESVLARRPSLSVEGIASGWLLCPNAPAVRSLDLKDFPLGTARYDFHLTNVCVPDGALPPITPPDLPDLPPDLGLTSIHVPWVGAWP